MKIGAGMTPFYENCNLCTVSILRRLSGGSKDKPGSGTLFLWRSLLQLDGFRGDKAFQIVFILEKNVLRIEGEISSINVQEPFDVRDRREELISIFFDGFKVVFFDLGRFRDFLQRDVSRLPFFFQKFPWRLHNSLC